MSQCSIEGCDKSHYAHGWCNMHWQRWRRHGDPLVKLDMRGCSAEERFWAKVDKNGPIPSNRPELGCCFIWLAHIHIGGYGIFWSDRHHYAHRFAYETYVGTVPEGLELDHLCRNKICVNPTHLEPVPHRLNVMRSDGITAKYARATHCKHGHEFTPENTYIPPSGQRCCRTCRSHQNRRRRRLEKV